MNLFLLAMQSGYSRMTEARRKNYEQAPCCRGLRLKWCDIENVSMLIGLDGRGSDPVIATSGSCVAAGTIRLDNRAEVARLAGRQEIGVSDIELVTGAIAQQGEHCILDLQGDFAFVVWDSVTRRLVAGRDAFGVKRLFYREDAAGVAFASHAALLSMTEQYDVESLTMLAAVCLPPPDRSVYRGVRAVAPGCLLIVQERSVISRQYWSPEWFEPREMSAACEAATYEEFRHLFTRAVQSRLTGKADTWAQLSGGLDSSSVVSIAQRLAEQGQVPHGVAGTISWVYRWSTDSDERDFARVVTKKYAVHNEVLEDWLWEEDGAEPPMTDEPGPEYIFHARERRTLKIIRAAGGRVLLTGLGSDHYLQGNMFFFADWVAQGHVGQAFREMLRRAALGRVSLWTLAYQNALLPLLPAAIQSLLVRGWKVPAWIPSGVAKRFNIEETAAAGDYASPRGRKYKGAVMAAMRSLPMNLGRHLVLEDELEVRHPFLYRPLVEFGLRLPPELCVQPHARKWVLREAMRGILPEVVRTRVGKGANAGCIQESLRHERVKLERMLRDPLLAQLGCVDAAKLQAAYASALQTTDAEFVGAVTQTLAVETWLQVRSGRWNANGWNV